MPDPKACLPGRVLRAAIVLCAAAGSSACAGIHVGQPARVLADGGDFHLPVPLRVETCRASLTDPVSNGAAELDLNDIQLLNWNVQKTRSAGWKNDYQMLAKGKHLVLMQEVSLREDAINDIDSSMHWSFAPGYRSNDQVSGVMTLSSIEPLTQCSFTTLEPVFRTPKATSITQYALTGSNATLVVVNLHAVNFSLGLGAFRRQFDQVATALAAHEGPIILSGDFNTWRAGRKDIIDVMAADMRLSALEFDDDRRMRILGRTLDHIYVRGLSAVHTYVSPVTTSDHNPMSATFGM